MFKFKCNNAEWTIEEVEKDKMTCESSEWTQGLTIYLEQKILLLKEQPNTIRTLKHELTHVWLYEYGHNQHNENKKYDYEDVCEIVACSNDFINEVVEQYVKGPETITTSIYIGGNKIRETMSNIPLMTGQS